MPLKFNLNAVDGMDDNFAEAAEMLERNLGSQETRKALRAALEIVNKDARRRVNTITGNLESGIKTTIETAADAPTVIETGVSYARTRAHHAHLVEGGHGGPHPAKAHPFWKPAVELHVEEAVNAVLVEAMNAMLDTLKEH
ncbi:MAG: hypothetical protein J5556_06985 [Deltaproteobacteria bacterium]|nr:hypothetical protein [Deltaproteobacteria bacterium]